MTLTRPKRTALLCIALFLGTCLQVVNIYGMFGKEGASARALLGVPSVDSTISLIDRAYREDGTSPEFLAFASKAYSNAIVYSWYRSKTRVAISDNWLLWALAWVDKPLNWLGATDIDNLFSSYETTVWQRALARGFGICSQNALGFADLLGSRYHIEASIIQLNGHVIVEANNTLLDPSVGIAIPMNLEEAQRLEDSQMKISKIYRDAFSPELVFEEYDAAQNPIARIQVAGLGRFYDSNGNYRVGTVKDYRRMLYQFERISDLMKYLIPLMVIALSFHGLYRRRWGR
jgi:hypothetical protein